MRSDLSGGLVEALECEKSFASWTRTLLSSQQRSIHQGGGGQLRFASFFSFQWVRDLEFLSVSLLLEEFWHLLENLFFGHKKEQNLLRDTSYYYLERLSSWKLFWYKQRIWYQFMCIKGMIMCSLFLWLCNLSSWRCFLFLSLGWCCWRSHCGITGLAMELFWQKMKAVCTMAAMTSLFARVHVSHVNISCSTDLLV